MNHTTTQIANHLMQAYQGGNWTSVSLKETLEGITWQQAIAQVEGLNSLATLLVHCAYYVSVAIKVLSTGVLEGKDTESFILPPIENQQHWEALVEKAFAEAEQLAGLIEKLPDTILGDDYTDAKYGSYYRNLHGMIEHLHYHLGQMVLIKKIINKQG